MKRRIARECALQLLFQYDFTRHVPLREELEEFWSMRLEPEDIRQFTEELLRGTIEHLPEIDKRIADSTQHWSLERMAAVDRNILRIATYELLFRLDIPVKVAINEAIEIAKKYGSQDSPSFINGILDRIAKELASLRPEERTAKKS